MCVEWGCNVKLFGPAPWGPREGSKGEISFNLNSHFQRFLYQTLCVFSQMKDAKHIRQDFHSVAWVMPQGWDFGALGCPGGGGGGKKTCKQGHVAYQSDGNDKQNRMQVNFSS